MDIKWIERWERSGRSETEFLSEITGVARAKLSLFFSFELVERFLPVARSSTLYIPPRAIVPVRFVRFTSYVYVSLVAMYHLHFSLPVYPPLIPIHLTSTVN